MELILTNQPDLVFMNVDGVMYHAFSFTLALHFYKIPLPKFIALSANTELAYQCMKHEFFDYLLTPITSLEIHKSMARYQKKVNYPHELICLKSYKDYHFLNIHEIILLKADNNTTDFHMLNGEIITAFKTLKTFEEKLPVYFKRIHKSYIINGLGVSRIDFGKATCRLTNFKSAVPFSKKFQGNMEAIYASLRRISF